MNDRERRKTKVLTKFRELYGHDPEGWVRAPGRAELLGTDTDDHQGYVLTMSIHLDTWIAYRRSGSAAARLHARPVREDRSGYGAHVCSDEHRSRRDRRATVWWGFRRLYGCLCAGRSGRGLFQLCQESIHR